MLDRQARTSSQNTWLLSLSQFLAEHSCVLRRKGVENLSAPETKAVVSPGQFWRFGGTLLQIGGWSSSHVSGWTWTETLSSRGLPKRHPRFQRGDFTSIPWDSLTGDSELLSISWKKCTPRISQSMVAVPVRYDSSPPPIPWPEAIKQLPPSIICTDGSWDTIGPCWDLFPRVGAGIALLYPNMVIPPLTASLPGNYFNSSQNNYTQELIGLLIGAAIKRDLAPSARLVTDSESAISALSGKRLGKVFNGSQFLHILRHLLHGASPQWVKAHTTPYPSPSETDKYGNFLADRAASRLYEDALPTDILLHIADSTGLWYIADKQNLGPATLPPTDGYLHAGLDYYQTRTTRHTISPKLYQVQFLLEAHGAISDAQRGALLKLILERFDDDRLRNEGSLTTLCPCGQLSHLSSWTHLCQCADIISTREKGLSRLSILLRHRASLSAQVTGKLRSSSSYDLWRCRWKHHDLLDFWHCTRDLYPDLWQHKQRGATKLLHQVFRIIASTSLELHTIGRRLRAPEATRELYGSATWARRQRSRTSRPRTRNAKTSGLSASPKDNLPKITHFFHPLPVHPRPPNNPAAPRRRPIIPTAPSSSLITSFFPSRPRPGSALRSPAPHQAMPILRAGGTSLGPPPDGAVPSPPPGLHPPPGYPQNQDHAVITNLCK